MRLSIALGVVAALLTLPAQAEPTRVLGTEDIRLHGLGLAVEPARQTVPKDIATVVSTFLRAPQAPTGLPPFAPDAEVRAVLRGPSFPTPVELRTAPNTPFTIPPLPVPGIHTVEDIRLVSQGEVLLRGSPEHVMVEVIERLLVTQVTARALSAEEIRQKNIVYDRSSFQAYNFSAAFAIQDKTVAVDFPVLLPKLPEVKDAVPSTVTLPEINSPQLPSLKTIIPDTLRLQTQVPNLRVIGFPLKVQREESQALVAPPIPGVIVIPGDIGFLNQFFSVMLMVGNAAPEGSGLVVTDLSAKISLPLGNDRVLGTPDDPLSMARTERGLSPGQQPVVQPGPDGKLGTPDDVRAIGPGEHGNAEYLVEGRREGSHTVEMEISGTLHGLPGGPVPVRGRAAGAVLVRNPTFTLTFTHPEVVSAGEKYTLDVTITNTSQSPANFVSLNLYPRNISGAEVVGEATREIESIPAGDSATVSFQMLSARSGKVIAATLDADGNVAGRFGLKTSVGELGVPLSPDSLVLPREASKLPAPLRDAAVGLLGKAWSVATAPAAALPKDLKPFSRAIVLDRAVEVAEAGFRKALHEPEPDTAAQLLMGFAGSDFARLGTLHPPARLEFVQRDVAGFDELRRKSVRGDIFAQRVADLLSARLGQQGGAAFHLSLAQKWSYRPAHLSVLLTGKDGPLPFTLSIVDDQGRRVGGTAEGGKVLKQIPYSEYLSFPAVDERPPAQMVVLAVPEQGTFTVLLEQVPDVPATAGYSLSVVLPDGEGGLKQVVYSSLSQQQVPELAQQGSHRLVFQQRVLGQPRDGQHVQPSSSAQVVDPAPTVLGVVQQAEADQLNCEGESSGHSVGRIVAVLFSEEVKADSVQHAMPPPQLSHFAVEANKVVGVALQPGRRIVFLALRDAVGPLVPRKLSASNVEDLRGQKLAPWSGPIETTVTGVAGTVSGRVLNGDGTPVPFAQVKLFYLLKCEEGASWVGISAKDADEQGRYAWDHVLGAFASRIVAVEPRTGDSRELGFSVQRDGQKLNVDVALLGRGTLEGITRSEDGKPLRDTVVRITSLTDNTAYGARTDAEGRFAIPRIPVGNVLIEAVNAVAKSRLTTSDHLPSAGALLSREFTLFGTDQTQTSIRYGGLSGSVLQEDGVTPVPDVPVYVYYKSLSQPGVACPGKPPAPECPIAAARTDEQGAFTIEKLVAGELRVESLDQSALQQGKTFIVLAPEAKARATVLLAGGLAIVEGQVVDADGKAVANARVGGGLSLTTAGSDGHFVLKDVPVGRREIVAVSDALGSSGKATVDLARAGEQVPVRIVLEAKGSVAGTVVRADGTPAVGIPVYLIQGGSSQVQVFGTATTQPGGGYRIDRVPLGEYKVSAFTAGFTDGNVVPAVVKAHGQVARADVKFRGGKGKVTGTVFAADGATPLKAKVGISGERVVVAGGQVVIGFSHVENFAIAETDLTTGRFLLEGALVGPFTLRAVGAFSPDPILVEGRIPTGGATVDVAMRLQATSQIRGTVLQPDGVVPVGENVIVRYKSDAVRVTCRTTEQGERCESTPQGIQEETVVTDPLGRFWLPVVNAGAFTLTVEDPVSGKVGRVRGSVKPGETADLPVRLLAQAKVTVVVRGSNSTPIPGARVKVQQVGYPSKEVTRDTSENGVAVFAGQDGFTEGELVIEATDTANGFSGRASGRILENGADRTLEVYLANASGTVFGTVYAPDRLTPMANAEVVLSTSTGPIAFTVTGPEGAYSIGRVPVGSFTVETFDPRTARRASRQGSIDVNGARIPVDLVQEALGMVRGKLLRAGSLEPLKGWDVTLQQKTVFGRVLPALRTMSSVDGSFVFYGASRGTFQLSAKRAGVNGSASAEGVLEREGQVREVPMVASIVQPLAGSVRGMALLPTGAPAANSIIELCPGAACADWTSAVASSAADDGSFSFQDVPLGRFSVRARAQTTKAMGASAGELSFNGDVAAVKVVILAVRTVRGRVERADGRAAAGVQVVLTGLPDVGCPISCSRFTDGEGHFEFPNVSARTFSLAVVDPISGLKGSAGGSLESGSALDVRIVLEPTVSLRGRVLREAGGLAKGMTVELAGSGGRNLYQETGADGVFTFAAAPLGAYTVTVRDPLGPGFATRYGTLDKDQDLKDLVLDEGAPQVHSMTPAASAAAVPVDSAIRVRFSEPILPSTVQPTSFQLEGPDGPVLAERMSSENDTVVTLKPVGLLKTETRYVLRVSGIKDRVERAMVADFVAAFTTVDRTPPAVVDRSPVPDMGGVPISAPIRIKYSEPIDPQAFSGSPLSLTGPQGGVTGTTSYLFGNTVLLFTPSLPLQENTVYRVQVQRARDLAGNLQAGPVDYQFRTFDRTPPEIERLSAANEGRVLENGVARVTAELGALNDIDFVDWFINEKLVATDRAKPFELSFQALPEYGAPGSQISVSALATDLSGIRGQEPASTSVEVLADQSPVVAITSPAPGASFPTKSRVAVSVHATDDLKLTQVAYSARTGRPGDAMTQSPSSQVPETTESFFFYVPADAEPGSTIAIHASATDSKGQVTAAEPVLIQVEDATAPAVEITGATSGKAVRAGEKTTVVVTAKDVGGIKAIRLFGVGVLSSELSRTLDPVQTSAVTSFALTIPTTAQPGQSLKLRAEAVDFKDNQASSQQIELPVLDTTPPLVQLELENEAGGLSAPIGGTVEIRVNAEDDVNVARIDLAAQGAFTFSASKAFSQPLSTSGQATFTVPVPSNLQPGAQIELQARAQDLTGNLSSPVSLMLTAELGVDVTLPASRLLTAGKSEPLEVLISKPAPAEGLRIDLGMDDVEIASSDTFVVIPAGQQSALAQVTGKAGGTTALRAKVRGVERALMTVTVNGGVVSGIVRDPRLKPVPGAQLTISGGGVTFNATTDENGFYSVGSVPGPAVSVKAIDPVTKLLGFNRGSMARQWGVVTLDVGLVPAGAISGTVLKPDGTTLAGMGVRVDLFHRGNMGQPVHTGFTGEAGTYEFPPVSLGEYVVQASSAEGSRGRAMVTITQTGQQPQVPVVFLGHGTIKGVVRDGGGSIVKNASLTFSSWDVFGFNRDEHTQALDDGSFEFKDVPLGGFSISARNALNQAGSVANSLTQHLGVVNADISLASYGSLEGKVYAADGETVVAGATVNVSGYSVRTDSTGTYRFNVLPLGPFVLSASDPGTRRTGSASGQLSTHGEQKLLHVTMLGQGSLLVTVKDANKVAVSSAPVRVKVTLDGKSDTLYGSTGTDGRVLLEHVLAGAYEVNTTVGLVQGHTGGLLGQGVRQEVTIELPPTASIAGSVFEPDGQTPASAGTVRIGDLRSVPIREGKYRFDGLPLGTYPLMASDGQGRRRAVTPVAQGVTLSSNSQVAKRDLTFIGLGTVSGRVVRDVPNDPGAGNFPVELRSLAPGFESQASTQTNPGGFYAFENVPVGAFSVSSGSLQQRLLGEAQGTLSQHEGTAGVDILLKPNVIEIPATRVNANNFALSIQDNGAVSWPHILDTGAASRGFVMEVVDAQGTRHPFQRSELPMAEESEQEIVLLQNNLAGLTAIRKVYVPRTGYFVRYLELLSNPTQAAITFQLRVLSRAGGSSAPIVNTSSGDTVLDVGQAEGADRWVVIDDMTDGDTQAFAFDGAGAPRHVAAASLIDGSRLSYEWRDVTLAPGQRVAFLHFGVLQTERAAAQASAERLAQLPPEALAGLSQEELAAIGNFVVPADGHSELPALPRLTGTVTGRVFEGNGTTPVQGATVRFRSSHPLFRRTQTVQTGADGSFTLSSRFDPPMLTVAVPVDDFSLTSTHPFSAVEAPATQGQFPPSGSTAVRNVSFTGTGILQGFVQWHTGVAVNGGTLQVSGGTPALSRSATISQAAQYLLTGLPEGTYTLKASVPHTQGTASKGQASAVVSAGQTLELNVQLEPTVTLTGQVRTATGALAPNVDVELRREGFLRSTKTDTGGHYSFPEAPLGSFTVRALEPTTKLVSSEPITLGPGSPPPLALTLAPVGNVTGVVSTNGTVVSGVLVTLRSAHPHVTKAYTATTQGNGQYTILNVPKAAFTLVVDDATRQLFGEASGQIETAGQQVTVPIPLSSNAVVLPITLKDANGFPFGLSKAGGVNSGEGDVFGKDAESSLVLEVSQPGGAAVAFTGANSGTLEQAGREVAIKQQSALQGLEVTRKIYVPRGGYFARYLEVLRNPTSAPVTVHLKVRSRIGLRSFGFTKSNVVQTSSGDSVLSVSEPDSADRWLILDDGIDQDPFLQANAPAVALVFDGPGAAQRVSSVVGPVSGDQVSYQWAQVTVQPQQTAVLMHFAVQQTSRAAAQASAERLSQLPPEALEGLSEEELSQLRNFVPPPTGESPLEPLPALTGTVKGQVLASDGTLGVRKPAVFLQSTHPLLSRMWMLGEWNTGEFGQFQFNAVPFHGFTLWARYPKSLALSPFLEGAFPGSATTTTQNVVFSNTGGLRGVLTRPGGAAAGYKSVWVDPTPEQPHKVSTITGSDGSYRLDGLRPGTYQLSAEVGAPSGTFGSTLKVTLPVTVEMGQIQEVPIVLPPSGNIEGQILFAGGQPLSSSMQVRLSGKAGTFNREAYASGANAQYQFPDVPTGQYVLEVTDPRTQQPVTAQVEVVEGQSASGTLRLPALGSIRVRVKVPGDQGVASSPVKLVRASAPQEPPLQEGTTDANGEITFTNVQGGVPVLIQAAHPSPNGNISRQSAELSIQTDNQQLLPEIILPALATVRVKVVNPSGAPVQGVDIESRNEFRIYYREDGQTDWAGELSIPEMPEGAFSLQVRSSQWIVMAQKDGVVGPADHGGTVQVLVTVTPLSGNITGRVVAIDGQTPVSGAYVTVLNVPEPRPLTSTVTTNANGEYSFTNVLPGSDGFVVRAQVYGVSSPEETQSGSFTTAGETKNIQLQLPLLCGTVKVIRTGTSEKTVVIQDMGSGQRWSVAPVPGEPGAYLSGKLVSYGDGVVVLLSEPGGDTVWGQPVFFVPAEGEDPAQCKNVEVTAPL